MWPVCKVQTGQSYSCYSMSYSNFVIFQRHPSDLSVLGSRPTRGPAPRRQPAAPDPPHHRWGRHRGRRQRPVHRRDRFRIRKSNLLEFFGLKVYLENERRTFFCLCNNFAELLGFEPLTFRKAEPNWTCFTIELIVEFVLGKSNGPLIKRK